jgi:SAM-dependent methyltransferase
MDLLPGISATLEPNPVVCADPDHSVLARICSGRRAARFGVLHTQAGHGGGQAGTSLYDLRTGAAFGGGSLDSIIVEANLRQCSDLADLLHEVGRVLKEGGLVAIKVDRLPNAMQVMASEVCVSSGALCSALRPGFRIVWQGRQGRIGTALVVSLVSYLKGQMTRLKLPFAAVFFWVLLRMPLEMLLGVSANLLGLVLNVLDTTDRNYVSSIVVARKTGGAAGTPGQAGPAWSWSPAGHRNISG